MGVDKFTPEARTLSSLRSAFELMRKDLAAVLGLKDGSLLSQYENGSKPLSYEYLEEVAATLGVPPEGVEMLLLAHRLLWELRAPQDAEAGGQETSPLEPTAAERWRMWRTVIAAAWTLTETLYAELARLLRAGKVKRALAAAEAQWALLESIWRAEGRDLVTVYPALRTPALAARVCEASAKAAARSFEEALELADFALFIAENVPGGEARRARAVGYCRAFRANALRVATEFDQADAELAQGWALYRAGDPSERELLPEWRLYALEASLRREQRRFPEALECVARALALCGGRPEAAGHILLKKEHIFHSMGDTEGVLSTLEEAAPYVEASGDPYQSFFLRWMVANSLCTLGRHAEAAQRLPEVRRMAIEQGMELNLIRVAWLSAKVDAGQGRIEEAVAGFDQVLDDFRAHKLPYEGALSALDLAVLLLERGRTAEVKELAVAMAWIFEAKGIAREALAGLSLFCEAARQEIATVEKTKNVIAEVEKAWRSAPPSQGKKGPRPALR